ncbi:AfsR/SARP family transcriptional regulator, partial [Streptomyces lasiicapitis]
MSRRHRDHYLALVERAATELRGPDQRRHLRLLDADAANLRRALDDAVRDGAAHHALRLVNALSWYWFLRGRLREAIRSVEAALAVAYDVRAAAAIPELVVSARDQARAWHAGFAVLVGEGATTGVSATVTDAYADSGVRNRAAVELSKDLTDRRDGARAQWFLGFALFGVGDQAASEELIRHALGGFTVLGDPWGRAAALCVRANQAHVRGDLVALERDGQRSAELFTELGDAWGQLLTVEPLAGLAQMAGDCARAARLHEDGLRMAEELGLWRGGARPRCGPRRPPPPHRAPPRARAVHHRGPGRAPAP